MNFDTPNDPTGILDMVFRKGPILMRAGGGSLSRECAKERLTPKMRERILELAREGKHGGTEIARMLGVPQSTAQYLIKRAGIKVPGRRRTGL
jgi:DNA-binding MarR family transcriptional regulator